uniref:ATR n=1 Tax=Arundo donax TaxID=35708 RepID=A0A0A9CMH5_ARUDO
MRICYSSTEPCRWFRECCQEPFVENWGKHWKDFSLQHLIVRHFAIICVIYLLDLWIGFHPIKLPTCNVDVLKNMPKTASIRHPFYHSTIFCKWYHCKGSDIKLSPAALRDFGEETVDHCIELHHA